MTTHDLERLAALALALLAAPGAGRAAPPAPASPFSPETIAALTAKFEADHVIDVLPDFLLLGAKRPGPELSYGEPKMVALVVDAKGRLVSQLEVALSVGDEGVSNELSYDSLGAGLIRTRQRNSSCSPESGYKECTESTSYTTYKLAANGTFETVTPDGRYCDRGSGEELELVADLEKPLQTSVTHRRKGKREVKLRVAEANPPLTRLVVRFPDGAVRTLALADDFGRLTSAGGDGRPTQTFARAACAK